MGGTDVNLNNIHARVTLGGGLNIGLDDVNADIGLDNINANIGLGLITTSSTLNANIGKLVTESTLGKIVTESTLGKIVTESKLVGTFDTDSKVNAAVTSDSKVDLGLDDIRIREFPPIQVQLAARPFRLHLPVNFKFCLEVLGVTLFKFSVCGEGMAIGEDYEPHATERCK